MKNCPQCGCVNDSINRYCRNCGEKFVCESTPAQTEPPAPTARPEDDMPIVPSQTVIAPAPDLTAEEREEDGDPFFKLSPDFCDQTSDTAPAPIPKCPIRISEPIDFDFSPTLFSSPARISSRAKKSPRSTHPVINECKKQLGGGAILVFLLFGTLRFLLIAIALFCTFDPSVVQWQGIKTPLPYLGTAALLLCSMICTALFLLGGWIEYAAARSRRKNSLATGGLSVVRAGCIGKIVLFSFCMLPTLIAFIAVGFGAVRQTITPMYAAIGGAIACAVLVFLVLAVIYYAFWIRAIGMIKQTAATGKALARLSPFLIVINSIVAYVICGIMLGYSLAPLNPFGVAIHLCSIISLTALSTAVNHYRTELSALARRSI